MLQIFGSEPKIEYVNCSESNAKLGCTLGTAVQIIIAGGVFYFLLEGAGLVELGIAGSKKVADFLNSGKYEYSSSVLKKMTDKYHNFPKLMDKQIFSNRILTRIDGRVEYAVKGNIGDSEGVYHITTKGSLIIHRVFITAEKWNNFAQNNGLPLIDKIK